MNTDDYKEIFAEEAEENVSAMNNALLEFEKNTGDLSPVNELFRSAHTLKGMAATMGYDRMAGFTHVMEEALDGIREGSIRTEKGIIDILFRAVDVIEFFLASIKESGVDSSEKSREVEEQIKRALGKENAVKEGGAAVKKEPPPAAAGMPLEIGPGILKEAESEGLKVYEVKVIIAKGCAFKNVRAFMVTRNLSEKGEIIKSNPPSKDIEEGNFDKFFYLGYVSKLDAGEIKNIVMKIAEIEGAVVNEMKEPENEGQGGKEKKEEPAEEKKETGGGPKKESVVSQSVRVNIEKLDFLMNLVGELVINKIRLDQISKQSGNRELEETVEEFDRIIDELQLEVTDVRMLPVSHIFNRYPRMVRDLAMKEGKEIDLEIEGGDIEIDRTVLEEIHEPLLHLIRNSIAHGIEKPEKREIGGKVRKGAIKLSARRERNSVIIEVADDGRGIDTANVRKKALEKGIVKEERLRNMPDDEAVNIVAMPGFSTKEVTDGLSGRGVGVDVVKTKVERFGGIFKIENFPGEGVKFILKLPLTLAIIQSLLVEAAGNTYAVPVIHTTETVEIPSADVKVMQKKRVVIIREDVIPLLSLSELLGKKREERELIEAVIVEVRDRQIALEVDRVLGQQEIAIKSLGDFLKYAKGFSGVTILGDGRVSLILDIQGLLESVNLEEIKA